MWVSVYDKDVFRFSGGTWSKSGGLDGLPGGWSIVQSADETGVLWFGYPGDRVSRVDGRHVQNFDSTRGLTLGNVSSILAAQGQVWVGGDLGLALLVKGHFVSIRNSSAQPFRWVTGIVQARNGDLWLNGMNGISRLPQKEVERVLRDPTHPVDFETFNHLDGVPGPTTQHASLPTAILASDGRIWFTMAGGIVAIDSTHLVRNSLVPPVTIWALSSGPMRYTILDSELGLPVLTTNVQIDYSAGSLTAPEKVKFRYKLDGSDTEWQDVGTRREARYTNLRPGHYVFRVTAANNDGVWNETGASIRFTIPPAFYQTIWFYLLLAAACTALLAILYRVRVQAVASKVRDRLEARLAERERIARDLHDTLLQGIQGLIWRFQAAADRIAPGDAARTMLDESLDRADRLLEESRDKVKELRLVPSEEHDLGRALAAVGAEFAHGHTAHFHVNEQGARRPLHPIAREEAFQIGREALSNAFRHAGAHTIEIDVTYGDTELQIRVRDDGQGIASDVLHEGGKPGHFGLMGMRERAKKLGANIQIWTKPGAGTEVDMRVPAAVAYGRPHRETDGKRSWLARIRSQ
jgi:signal transduction histidine kinase